jgi:hypothetical protein
MHVSMPRPGVRCLQPRLDGQLDWDAFGQGIRLSTHFLDNLSGLNKCSVPEMEQLSQSEFTCRAGDLAIAVAAAGCCDQQP